MPWPSIPNWWSPAPPSDGVYPCLGEDEWCVISLRSEADREAAAEVHGRRPGTGSGGPVRARRTKRPNSCSARGGGRRPMHRRPDVLADPQLVARGLYQPMTHPLFDGRCRRSRGPHRSGTSHGPAFARHPLPGQDTREICRDILGFDDAETERLMADGVLFTTTERARAMTQVYIGGRFRPSDDVTPVIEAATGEPLGDGAAPAPPTSTTRSPRPVRRCPAGGTPRRRPAPTCSGPWPRR